MMRALVLAATTTAAAAGTVASLQAKVYGTDTYAKCSGLYRRSTDKVCTTSAAPGNCTKKYIWDRTEPDGSRFIYYRNGAWRVTGSQWREGYVNGSITHGGNFIKSDGDAGEWFGAGWNGANATATSVGDTYDDTHVTTLAGSRMFMHGVGVFEYASVGELFRSQVYMCPVANCTAAMVKMGDCVTFISAVAVKTPNHTVVFHSNAVTIDGKDRKIDDEHRVASPSLSITTVGSVDSWRPRIDHDKLAKCNDTPGQNCSTVGWVLDTPDLTLNVNVMGPFERGWLREEGGGNRTFDVDLAAVRTNGKEVRGIINGDKNGFFKAAGDVSANALQPELWAEAAANNVVAGSEIFPIELKAHMDSRCGPPQELQATKRLREKLPGTVFAW
jgi:hypothetical protein